MKKFKRILKNVLKIILIILLIVIVYVLLKKPALNRDWTDDAQTIPSISIEDNLLKVKNIRDWRYEYQKTISWNYYEETFDLNKMQKAYFVFNPFGKWAGVGHGFFLFEFSDGKTVSVSVEARRENGEPFSAISGLFNNFEMWYSWGSAADHFSRRAVFHNEDLYIYDLIIKPQTAKGLLIELAKVTKDLETKPEFYNTITSNCTNVLADASNNAKKGSIPWNWARIFTGYADDKLYELKLIPHDKPFEQIYEESRIDSNVKEVIKNNQMISKEEFWSRLLLTIQ